uniref:Uncharacterized protein n=1 Tax=Vespula pensylvanica TaxID=30213 RepID=A0A834NY76_VESPE|nr:hypothetical protein H0235_009265 [Vespula pensylvanica]
MNVRRRKKNFVFGDELRTIGRCSCRVQPLCRRQLPRRRHCPNPSAVESKVSRQAQRHKPALNRTRERAAANAAGDVR